MDKKEERMAQDTEAIKQYVDRIRELSRDLRSDIDRGSLTYKQACSVIGAYWPPALACICFDGRNQRVTGRMHVVLNQMANGYGIFDYWCSAREVAETSLTDWPLKPCECCRTCRKRTECPDYCG